MRERSGGDQILKLDAAGKTYCVCPSGDVYDNPSFEQINVIKCVIKIKKDYIDSKKR